MTKAEVIGNLSIYGSKKQREKAKKVLERIKGLDGMSEGKARLKIQDIIDKHKLTASILYNHNTVWSRDRIIRNLKRIIKAGTLYDARKPRRIPVGSMLSLPAVGGTILSKYFYEFLHGVCGSIAHYNIQGWVCQYPTIDYLKKFFKENEYGVRVMDWLPGWYTDARRIVEEIETLLFPFQTYLRQRTQ